MCLQMIDMHYPLERYPWVEFTLDEVHKIFREKLTSQHELLGSMKGKNIFLKIVKI